MPARNLTVPPVYTINLQAMNRIEVVSWDVDGTLYSLPRLRLAVASAAVHHLGRGQFRHNLRELRELSQWQALMNEVRRRGGDLRTLYDGPHGDARRRTRERVRALEGHWYGDAIERIGPRPEVGPLYAAFRARGIRQVVLSDYDSDYKLTALQLATSFDAVFSGEAIGWLKPAPQLYQDVARRLGVSPARWLHIGDRVDRDQDPARSIGCQTFILGTARWPSGLAPI